MYEKICLCARCADDYRAAGINVIANLSDREKGTCEVCKRPCGLSYSIERPDVIPHCPKCGTKLIKTATLKATYYSCGCGYEKQVCDESSHAHM